MQFKIELIEKHQTALMFFGLGGRIQIMLSKNRRQNAQIDGTGQVWECGRRLLCGFWTFVISQKCICPGRVISVFHAVKYHLPRNVNLCVFETKSDKMNPGSIDQGPRCAVCRSKGPFLLLLHHCIMHLCMNEGPIEHYHCITIETLCNDN